MSRPKHRYTIHNDTYEVSVAWAMICLRHEELLPGYRAAMMLQRYPAEGNIPRAKLVQDYADVLGLEQATAYNDIRDMLTPRDIDGMTIQFAREEDHVKRGKILRRGSWRWMATHNNLTDFGTATIRREALESLHTLRMALYEVFLMANAAYQKDDGFATISRGGITRLVGVKESTQKRYELDLKVEVRENYAILMVDSPAIYAQYGPRTKPADVNVPGRQAIQIRNSYRAHGRYVIRLQLSRELANRPRLTQQDRRTTVSDEKQPQPIRPERGDSRAKQTFHEEPAPEVLGDTADRTVDIRAGDEPLARGAYQQYRNAPTQRRYYARYHRGDKIRPDNLQNLRDYLESPAWNADFDYFSS